MALGFLVVTALAGRAVAADDQTLKLSVEEKGFAPAELEGPAGGRIRLEVTNGTSAAIEFESFELNRERVIQPGQTAAVYLSGLSAGKYEFFDDFHQSRRGVLVIK
jgi:plastocyanin